VEPIVASPPRDAAPDSVFFVGDSITLGWRDEEIRGWPVRVMTRLQARAVTAYNLGVRGDTSGNILARWQDEVRRRLRLPGSAAVVFAYGANDAKLDRRAGGPVLPLDVVRDNTRRILGEATRRYRVLFVGPAPVEEDVLERVLNPDGGIAMPSNRQIGAVSATLAEEAAAVGVPYLDLGARLAADPAWFATLRETDGIHPSARGYDIIAGHVAAWAPWAALFAER
jgi:lysophospholipase L1-like esterase